MIFFFKLTLSSPFNFS